MPCEYSITHCTHVLTRHLGVPYSTVLHKLGASSFVPFKYPAILFRRLGHINAPKLSDSDYSDYSVVEGLRLMSQLKYVYFLLSSITLPPHMLNTDRRSPPPPPAPRHHPPLRPSPSPQIQTGIWAKWPPNPPKDQLARRRNARVHTPEFRRPPDPRLRGFARRSESR
jgi:hypothetical protein